MGMLDCLHQGNTGTLEVIEVIHSIANPMLEVEAHRSRAVDIA